LRGVYKSLTFGTVADHKRFTLATDIQDFCDPQNPCGSAGAIETRTDYCDSISQANRPVRLLAGWLNAVARK
jgi:hypothetical protein